MRNNLINMELLAYSFKKAGKEIRVEGLTSLKSEKDEIIALPNGIFSNKLGNAHKLGEKSESISCDCGKLTTKLYYGALCDTCNTVVTVKNYKEISATGFIDLGPYKVITSNGYYFLTKLFGPSVLNDIILFNQDVDYNGLRKTSYDSKSYKKIGLTEFYNRYEYILDDVYNKKVKKLEDPEKINELTNLYNFLRSKKKRMFTNKIPVMSMSLRNVYISKSGIRQSSINNIYQEIQTAAEILKMNASRLITRNKIVDELLYNIQTQMNTFIVEIIDKKMTYKTHLPRRDIAGNNMHMCGSNVIIPNSDNVYDIDEIEVNYRFFTAIYEPLVLNAMTFYNDVFGKNTLYQNLDILKKSRNDTHPNEEIVKICNALIENRKPGDEIRLLLNRAPSLNLGSMQCMTIKKLIYDKIDKVSDLVLTVPLTSLKMFEGDFDGDTLLGFAIFDKDISKIFYEALSPKGLIIDKTRSKNYNNQIGILGELKTMLNELLKTSKIRGFSTDGSQIKLN